MNNFKKLLLILLFAISIKSFSINLKLMNEYCEQGDGKSCYELSEVYANGEETIKDYVKAKWYLLKSCSKNDARGCFNLAIVENKPEFYKKAKQILEKNCNTGDIKSCTNLGWIYEYGLGVKLNYKKSIEIYSKSCDKGDAFACLNLGLAYKEGKGVNINYQKAQQLLDMSCNMGNETACYNLRNLNNNSNNLLKYY